MRNYIYQEGFKLTKNLSQGIYDPIYIDYIVSDKTDEGIKNFIMENSTLEQVELISKAPIPVDCIDYIITARRFKVDKIFKYDHGEYIEVERTV